MEQREVIRKRLEQSIEQFGGIEWGSLDGEPFAIVDDWRTVEGLLTEAIHAAGCVQLYDAAIEHELKSERYPRTHKVTLTDGQQVWAVTDFRLTQEGLYHQFGDNGPVSVPDDAEIAREVFDDFLCNGNWGFEDEYRLCADCYQRVIRTAPDSYGWVPNYWDSEDGAVCSECARSHAEDILEEYANKPRNLPPFIDWDAQGLVKLDDVEFQNGVYGGQKDDPQAIIRVLKDHEIDCWFDVMPGQFDVTFWVYVRDDDEAKAREILEWVDVTLPYDPAEVMKRGLEQASAAMSEVPPGEGPIVAKIGNDNGEATVNVRRITPEDFIEGRL